MEENKAIDNYKLIKINQSDENNISLLHKWNLKEKEREIFTCRPVKPVPEFDKYYNFINEKLKQHFMEIYLMKSATDITKTYGKITMFDYNARNHSTEFGYYLPKEFRSQGLGKIMTTLFLSKMFSISELNLNKLYATTASGNLASIKLLEALGFHLDGRLREHYWIGEKIEDQLHYSILKREWKGKNHISY